MHALIEELYGMVTGTQAMRDSLLETLTDADLKFVPGGSNPTLGALFRDIGEVQNSYTESLKTFTQDWTYRSGSAEIEGSVARLKEWLKGLDEAMTRTVDGLDEAALGKTINRGFEVPVRFQLDIYLQALLIFLAKATVYFRAMGKPLPEQVQAWIG